LFSVFAYLYLIKGRGTMQLMWSLICTYTL